VGAWQRVVPCGLAIERSERGRGAARARAAQLALGRVMGCML
jgi:hypothetical protein